jgi:F-type H+-transporting ATPase subunit alpha
MVELLKQNQYEPRSMVQQVTSIFAGVNGLMDDIPIEQCRDFERELNQFLETRHSAVCADILDKKEITSETQDTLRGAINECKSTFLSKVGAA